MKEKYSRRKRGIGSLLIANYIIFTVAIIFIIVFVILLTASDLSKSIVTDEKNEIIKYNTYLNDGNYDKVPIEKLFGRNSKIAILDKNYNVIYNDSELNICLSKEELNYVSDENSDIKIETEDIITDSGLENHVIKLYSSSNSNDKKNELYILDSEYNLLYSSGNYISDDITEQEYNVISQKIYSDYYLKKYSFGDENKLLLIFQPKNYYLGSIEKIISSFSNGFKIFIVGYIILTILFIIWMKKKITKPLAILSDSFNNFEIGDNKKFDYKGPREFEEIFYNFDKMSIRLTESEVERKRLEDERKKMIADIAHDLKTPVTVISGYAKALSDGVIPKEQTGEYIKIIESRAGNLNYLINTFYEYSKMERSDYRFVMEKTDMSVYFADYIATKYNELETMGFIPEINMPQDDNQSSTDFYCMVDRSQLKRAFDNIINNAVKHNDKGVKIFFELKNSLDTIQIILGDNGCGIPQNLKSTIFEPFVVGEKSRNKTGSGLGLSISKRIIEAHNGTIELYEDEKYKTAYMINIPLIKNR